MSGKPEDPQGTSADISSHCNHKKMHAMLQPLTRDRHIALRATSQMWGQGRVPQARPLWHAGYASWKQLRPKRLGNKL